MLNFNSILLGSENPKELSEFYKNVFQKDPEWSGGEFVGFRVGIGNVIIGPHDSVQGKSQNPERLMINLETDDVPGEFERIRDLGAQVIAGPYNPDEEPEGSIATFADPDGNYFQLMSPMPEQ